MHKYCQRHGLDRSSDPLPLPSKFIRGLIRGVCSPVPTMTAAPAAVPLRLCDLSRFSVSAMLELFGSTESLSSPVHSFLSTLGSSRRAHRLLCQGMSIYPVAAQLRELLSHPLVSQRLSSGHALRVVSAFSGVETTTMALSLLGVSFTVSVIADIDPSCRSAAATCYPGVKCLSNARQLARLCVECDLFIAGMRGSAEVFARVCGVRPSLHV